MIYRRVTSSMPVLALMLALNGGAAWALPLATAGPDSPARAREALERVVRLEVDAPALDPALANALPVLVEALLEGEQAMEVIPPPPERRKEEPAAGWTLKLSVSGKGPWKVTPRAVPTGDAPSSASRVNGSRVSFSNMEDLQAAAEAIAAEMLAGWRAAGVLKAAPARPSLRDLAASPRAIGRYLDAVRALRSGSAAGAAALLDQALADDPRSALASAQKAWLDLSTGAKPVPCAATGEGSAGMKWICEAIAHLAAGEPAKALQVAERVRLEAPQLAWVQIVAGLALAAEGRSREALAGWRQVAAIEPDDPRARLWLGLSAMAAGEFAEAAAALHAARERWPELWRAYALEAECNARLRDTARATEVVREMKRQMEARHAVPDADDRSPDLLLGSLQLMEGHFVKALEIFQSALESLEKAGAPISARRTLQETIVEMIRDLAIARDPLTRDRQLQEADAALARLEESLPASERDDRPWPLLRLQGLLQVKRGQTADAWRTVERIRAGAERPGYTAYEEAYLSAAIMLKEGDYEGAATQFRLVAQVRGSLVDLVDLAQLLSRMKRYDDAKGLFVTIEERLSRYEPNGEGHGELILTNPHMSLLVPVYHFSRAQQGYFVGDTADSRKHYGRMLKYFQSPEEQFMPFVSEARGRGAQPE